MWLYCFCSGIIKKPIIEFISCVTSYWLFSKKIRLLFVRITKSFINSSPCAYIISSILFHLNYCKDFILPSFVASRTIREFSRKVCGQSLAEKLEQHRRKDAPLNALIPSSAALIAIRAALDRPYCKFKPLMSLDSIQPMLCAKSIVRCSMCRRFTANRTFVCVAISGCISTRTRIHNEKYTNNHKHKQYNVPNFFSFSSSFPLITETHFCNLCSV